MEISSKLGSSFTLAPFVIVVVGISYPSPLRCFGISLNFHGCTRGGHIWPTFVNCA